MRLCAHILMLAALASAASVQARFRSDPGTRERLSGQGAEVVPGSPEQFGGFVVRAKMTKWAAVIKRAAIQPDWAPQRSTW